MSEWQPIETAPKDGTWVLGFQRRSAPQDTIQVWTFSYSENLWINAADSNDFDEQPSHWMPLPTPPGEEG
ncbi:DUF551 domain-containing protein [Denitrobaculum tricleocarpae]